MATSATSKNSTHARGDAASGHAVSATVPVPAAPRRLGGIEQRATFAVLRRAGREVRGRSLSVVFVPADQLLACSDLDSPPGQRPSIAVAFATGRHLGGAVVRNRLRRRAREIFRRRMPEIPDGAYLVRFRARAVDATFDELDRDIGALFGRLFLAPMSVPAFSPSPEPGASLAADRAPEPSDPSV